MPVASGAAAGGGGAAAALAERDDDAGAPPVDEQLEGDDDGAHHRHCDKIDRMLGGESLVAQHVEGRCDLNNEHREDQLEVVRTPTLKRRRNRVPDELLEAVKPDAARVLGVGVGGGVLGEPARNQCLELLAV